LAQRFGSKGELSHLFLACLRKIEPTPVQMKSLASKLTHEKSLELSLVSLPAMACVIALRSAKERVPMQWNLQGEVTWYASASWGLPLIPVILILIYVRYCWLEKRDLRRYRETNGRLTAHGKATRQIRLAVVLILSAISFVQIAWTLGHRPDTSRGIVAIVALLIAFVGNQFGKLKPNSYVGFRIPWTMASEDVWRRTHRVAGWLWTTTGAAIASLCWFLPVSEINPRWAYVWLSLLIVPPLFVSWNATRTQQQQ
jgi:uncharacterized membrane protein